MADDDKKVVVPGEPTDKKPAVTEEPKKPETPAWKAIAGDKFKDETELAKAYFELEKEKGKQSEELGQAREFTQTVVPLVELIRDDPELFKLVEAKMKAKGQPADMTKATPAEKSEATKEVRSVATDLIIARFEEAKGIDKLDPDARKAMRERIGGVVAELTGQALGDIDLRRLNKVLDNAYVLANKDDLVKKSELEALAKSQGLDAASIASMNSSQGKKTESLTPDEARVAERMGLTQEQYLDGKKKVKR